MEQTQQRQIQPNRNWRDQERAGADLETQCFEHADVNKVKTEFQPYG